jgi:Mn-dependent transcriptional regulator
LAEISEPLENYLKEIYELEELKGHARVSDLILIFGVSPGTISSALAKLERMNLVTRKDRKINLTEEGRKLAERLIRAHRLSERLLTDIIGIDWVRAHEIAHRLEHVWPDDVLERLDEILGRPRTCPHGHPIPGRVGKVGGSQAVGGEARKVQGRHDNKGGGVGVKEGPRAGLVSGQGSEGDRQGQDRGRREGS